MLLYVACLLTIPIIINAVRMMTLFLMSFCMPNEDQLDITPEDALLGFTSPYFEVEHGYAYPALSYSSSFDSTDESASEEENDLQTISDAIPFFS
jgi:hypothetical protein